MTTPKPKKPPVPKKVSNRVSQPSVPKEKERNFEEKYQKSSHFPSVSEEFIFPMDMLHNAVKSANWVTLPIIFDGLSTNSQSTHSRSSIMDDWSSVSSRVNRPLSSLSTPSLPKSHKSMSSLGAVEAAMEIGLQSFDPSKDISNEQLKTLLNSVPPKKRSIRDGGSKSSSSVRGTADLSNGKRSIGIGTSIQSDLIDEGQDQYDEVNQDEPVTNPVPLSVVRRREVLENQPNTSQSSKKKVTNQSFLMEDDLQPKSISLSPIPSSRTTVPVPARTSSTNSLTDSLSSISSVSESGDDISDGGQLGELLDI
ncbi:hypothetical protein GEMRC1_010537 [Eukaryota sp. GEM-RC1]